MMPANDDHAGVPCPVLDAMAGGISGMLRGAPLSPPHQLLVLAAVLGDLLADAPEEVREDALDVVVSAVRAIGRHEATPKGKPS